MSYNSHHNSRAQSRETVPAEVLAVARRPKEASRENHTAVVLSVSHRLTVFVS